MSGQHTPGPWKFDAESGEIFYDDGDVCPHIAMVNNEGVSIEQFRADARLIAAAPDLLAMLERLLGTVELNLDEIDLATQDAIDDALALLGRVLGEHS